MFYPNLHMSALMPQSIGIFTSLFKQEGYTLDLFDCTHYQDIDEINLGRNTNDESKFFHLFEIYKDSKALDFHRNTKHYKDYRSKIITLLSKPIEVKVLNPIDNK